MKLRGGITVNGKAYPAGSEIGDQFDQRAIDRVCARDPSGTGEPLIPGAHDEPLVGLENPNWDHR